MGQITDQAKAVYALGPSAEPSQPNKNQIVSLFQLLEMVLGTAISGLVIGNSVAYATRSALFADLARPAGTFGIVYNDSTAANNGVYVKAGASGSGSWSITGLALPSTFAADLANVVAGLATEVAARTATTNEVVAARQGAESLSARLTEIAESAMTDADLATAITNALSTYATDTELSAAINPLLVSITDAVTKADNALAASNGSLGQAFARPGDARALFTSTLTGSALSRPSISAGIIASAADLGSVLRIRGIDTDVVSGYLDIARRIDFAIDPSRSYLVTATIGRNVDPSDPANNAVEVRWQSLNANKGSVSNVRLGGILLPTVAGGPLRVSFLIGKAGAPGNLVYTIPPTAVYGFPLVRVYGNGAETDIASIDVRDITDQATGGVDLSALTDAVNSKLTNSVSTNRLLGRKTAGTGVAEEIAPVRGVSIDATGIGLEDMPEATLKGRVAGAGGGTPTNVTAEQIRSIIGLKAIIDAAIEPFLGLSTSTNGAILSGANFTFEASADGLTFEMFDVEGSLVASISPQLTALAGLLVSSDEDGPVRLDANAARARLLGLAYTFEASDDGTDFVILDAEGSVVASVSQSIASLAGLVIAGSEDGVDLKVRDCLVTINSGRGNESFDAEDSLLTVSDDSSDTVAGITTRTTSGGSRVLEADGRRILTMRPFGRSPVLGPVRANGNPPVISPGSVAAFNTASDAATLAAPTGAAPAPYLSTDTTLYGPAAAGSHLGSTIAVTASGRVWMSFYRHQSTEIDNEFGTWVVVMYTDDWASGVWHEVCYFIPTNAAINRAWDPQLSMLPDGRLLLLIYTHSSTARAGTYGVIIQNPDATVGAINVGRPHWFAFGAPGTSDVMGAEFRLSMDGWKNDNKFGGEGSFLTRGIFTGRDDLTSERVSFLPDMGALNSFSETSIVGITGGRSRAWFRTTSGIYTTVSEPGDLVWSTPVPWDQTNTTARTCFKRLPSGRVAAAWNDWPGRVRMTVGLSEDDGATFPRKVRVFREVNGAGSSYPSMVGSSDGTILISFENNRNNDKPGGKRMVLCGVDEEALWRGELDNEQCIRTYPILA